MSQQPFSGVRVVELGGMVSAAYAAKLLADLGAEVIKVEPPAGDAARRAGPFPPGENDSEASALFLYLNTNKRSVTLGEAAADRERLLQLAASCDVLIENVGEATMGELGLGWETLQQLNPQVIHASITPYGRTGPLATVPGDELTINHAGGLGNLLPTRSRDVDRAPVRLGGYQAAYHGGLTAALAAAAALRGEGDSLPLLIDVSLQEVFLALVSPMLVGSRYLGSTWSRVPDRPPAMGRMKTRDGYVILNAFDDHHFAVFRDIMGNPKWCSGGEWLKMTYRANHLMDVAPQIDAWMAQQSKADIHRLAGDAGIPIGPINDSAEVMSWPQYSARDYFVEVDHPRTGPRRHAGWPYKFSRTAPAIRSPAPLLGSTPASSASFGSRTKTPTKAVGTERSSSRRTRAGAGGTAALPAEGAKPLAGLRILEFCWVWAGPYAGSLLGALGADVIKVESHKRMDLTRRSVLFNRADHQPRMLPPNDGMAFHQVNLNKRSLTLDLTRERGRQLARRLAVSSDAVVDNLRPGALDKLGLGAEELLAQNRELIVASSSGRGRGGPDSEFLGYAMVHQGIGGGAHITGYPDGPPSHSGGDVDLMNAMALAFAIVAAVHHRDRTGEGQFIDYSQCEGVTSLLGDVLLGYELTGVAPGRCGNRHPVHAPSGVFRCWGVDRWLALEIHSDAEFATLADVLGRGDLAEDQRFATAAARKQNEEALDAAIEAFTRERDRDSMVRNLRRAGLRAAPSADALDLYADPHLAARSAFVTVEHPAFGKVDLVREPWLMGEEEPRARRAPLLGEHTDEILGELGLEESEIAELRRSEVIL